MAASTATAVCCAADAAAVLLCFDRHVSARIARQRCRIAPNPACTARGYFCVSGLCIRTWPLWWPKAGRTQRACKPRWPVAGATLKRSFVMKLSPQAVEQTLTQFEAQALPDNHPAVRAAQSVVWRTHLFPRRQRVAHRRTGKATDAGGKGRGGEACELEQFEPHQPRAASSRVNRPRGRARGSLR